MVRLWSYILHRSPWGQQHLACWGSELYSTWESTGPPTLSVVRLWSYSLHRSPRSHQHLAWWCCSPLLQLGVHRVNIQQEYFLGKLFWYLKGSNQVSGFDVIFKIKLCLSVNVQWREPKHSLFSFYRQYYVTNWKCYQNDKKHSFFSDNSFTLTYF